MVVLVVVVVVVAAAALVASASWLHGNTLLGRVHQTNSFVWLGVGDGLAFELRFCTGTRRIEAWPHEDIKNHRNTCVPNLGSHTGQALEH